MSNVVDMAQFRAQRKPPPPPKPPTKQEIAQGVVDAFASSMPDGWRPPLQSAVRLVAALGARAIAKQVAQRGDSIGTHGRFQFFGVKRGGGFALLGRVNCVSSADELGFRSEMYLIDPVALSAIGISPDDNMTKNNTFTVLVTLPMSDFYTL